MKRYITVNNFDKMELVEDSINETTSDEYVVDDSCFIPMSEAIRQLEVSSGIDNVNLQYDFEDGRDNGMQIPIGRRKSVKDIAEVSSEIMSDINNLSDKISKNQKKREEINAFEKELAAASVSKGSASSNTPSE